MSIPFHPIKFTYLTLMIVLDNIPTTKNKLINNKILEFMLILGK